MNDSDHLKDPAMYLQITGKVGGDRCLISVPLDLIEYFKVPFKWIGHNSGKFFQIFPIQKHYFYLQTSTCSDLVVATIVGVKI